MREKYCQCVTKNYNEILNGLLPESVADHLLENQVLKFDEYDAILSKRTTRQKSVELFKIVLRKPDGAWDPFLKSLRGGAHGHIADLLAQSELEYSEVSSYVPSEGGNSTRGSAPLEFFAASIIYCEENVHDALIFKELLERVITMPHHFGTIRSMGAGSVLDNLAVLFNNSSYIFMYVTKDFISDSWSKLQKDELIMASIKKDDQRWRIVPVMPQRERECEMPFGLASLNPFRLYEISDRQEDIVEAMLRTNSQNMKKYIQEDWNCLFRDRRFTQDQELKGAQFQARLSACGDQLDAPGVKAGAGDEGNMAVRPTQMVVPIVRDVGEDVGAGDQNGAGEEDNLQDLLL